VPIDPQHYVPILLTKQGERLAVRDLPQPVRGRLTPLFVISPIPWDFEEEVWAKSLDEHLVQIPNELRTAWGTSAAFIDLLLVDDDGPLGNGLHPLDWVISQAAAFGLPLIPTVSPTRTSAYRTAATVVIARDHRGACIRLQVAEWPVNLPGRIDPLLTELGVGAGDVDLVLDLGDETGPLALTVLRQQLASLPHRDAWRSLIVAGAAMPREMPAGKLVHVLSRDDWTRYLALRSGDPTPERIPTFADYAIAHPDPTFDIDPRFMSLSAQVRYATGDHWLISKGPLWKGTGGAGIGGAAMPAVAAGLQAHPDYLGNHHCALEQWLGAITPQTGGGNPMTWRRYGTLHHLTVVTEQLATLPAA